MLANSTWSVSKGKPKVYLGYTDISAATSRTEEATFARKVSEPLSTSPISNIYYLRNQDNSKAPTTRQLDELVIENKVQDDFFTINKESHLSKLLGSFNLKFAPENEVESIAKKIANQVLFGEEPESELLLTKINQEWFSLELIAEICDRLGRAEDSQGKNRSLLILTTLLSNHSAQTRDEAALGLALLDDKRAIPALEQSLENERVSVIKRSLSEIIDQLSSA